MSGNAFLAAIRKFEQDDVPTMLDNVDALLGDMNTSAKAVTWNRVKAVVEKDPISICLRTWIMDGCPATSFDQSLQPYWSVRTKLRINDGVPMLGDRTIIPKELRSEVLDTLHAAHQGRHSMILRASDVVYWPGFVTDID